jgi:hypothetical protein
LLTEFIVGGKTRELAFAIGFPTEEEFGAMNH